MQHTDRQLRPVRWFPLAARNGLARLGALLAVGWLACAAAVAGPSPGTGNAGFYNEWAWFKNTYWIVPPQGIYSVFHSESTNRFIVDRGQTVFHITDYFNGYFTGAVVVKLTVSQYTTCQFVLGQVTPEGRVFMTMYGADSGAVVNYPLGQMVKKDGQWTMVNQMTGPSQAGTLSHWAYMVQSRPGSPSFLRLPFAAVSIPQFMSSCPPGPSIENVFN